MSPEIVFAMYRPNAGKEKELEQLVKQHSPTLRKLELITDREVVLARAKNGTIIEVFEWRSKDATKRAHEHPAVAQIWEQMGKYGSFATLGSLDEAASEFPHFTPIA